MSRCYEQLLKKVSGKVLPDQAHRDSLAETQFCLPVRLVRGVCRVAKEPALKGIAICCEYVGEMRVSLPYP